MLTRRRIVAGAVTALAVAALAGPDAAAEVPVSQVGWWTRAPAPPAVPQGGIAVGAAPDGDLTVGAVQLDTGEGASSATLRLVETGGQGAAIAALQVCPTTASWSASEGGSLADAPAAECDVASSPMARAEDGTWTADVTALLAGRSGPVGLVVRPATGAVAFQVSFAPPIVDGTVTESGSSGGTDASTSDGGSSSPSFEDSGASSPSMSSFPVEPPAPVTPDADVETSATTPTSVATDEVASSATGATIPFTPALGAGAGQSASSVTKSTLVAWFFLAAIVGVGVAGLSWLRAQGRLQPAALLVALRRGRD